jgi:hypothetical protein
MEGPYLKTPTTAERVDDLRNNVGYGESKRDHKLRLRDVTAVLEENGFDPIQAILDVMDQLDTPLKVKTCLSLAEFVHPKKKAVEHSGPGGADISMSMKVEFV